MNHELRATRRASRAATVRRVRSSPSWTIDPDTLEVEARPGPRRSRRPLLELRDAASTARTPVAAGRRPRTFGAARCSTLLLELAPARPALQQEDRPRLRRPDLLRQRGERRRGPRLRRHHRRPGAAAAAARACSRGRTPWSAMNRGRRDLHAGPGGRGDRPAVGVRRPQAQARQRLRPGGPDQRPGLRGRPRRTRPSARTPSSARPTARTTRRAFDLGPDEEVDWDQPGSAQNAEATAEGLTLNRIEDGAFDPRHPEDFYFVTTEGGNGRADADRHDSAVTAVASGG